MKNRSVPLVALACTLLLAGLWLASRPVETREGRGDAGAGGEDGHGASQRPPKSNRPKSPGHGAKFHSLVRGDDWRTNCSEVLSAFLNAETIEEKALYVIGGTSRVSEMKAFYGDKEKVDDTDTPLDQFSHFALDVADRKRGLFLMRCERPAQYKMSEFFRPVAPLESQLPGKDPGLLLSAFAARENFAMEPVRVLAFFKEVGDRVLLDWDIYIQTKYRSLRHFAKHPQPGHSEIFRVMAREVPPPRPADRETAVASELRSFRFSDPAHVQDFLVVPVRSGTDSGRILAELAWIDLPDKQPQDRYATIEIGWTQEADPQVVLRNVICWELLGLGGEVGNANPGGR